MSVLDSTSWSLLHRVASGVPRDREDFGRRYEPLIRSYFAARWRLSRSHDLVADATQEVFVRLFSPDGPLSRVDSERPGGFRGYLRGVVRFVAAEIERGLRRRRETLTPDADRTAGVEPSPSDAFDRAWAEFVTDEAWALLREKAASDTWARWRLEVLTLRYAEELSCEEIAARIGELDVAQVYRLLASGRSQFRRAMFTVLSSHHPRLAPRELEAKCREVIESL